MQSKGNDDLDINANDILASTLKASVSLFPVGGAFISELVGTILPQQRMDRLVNYARALNSKLDQLPSDLLNKLKQEPEFVDLIEESFIQASRAISETRREYIAATVSNGITNEAIEIAESKYLLRLLSELNDVEVIWLRSFVLETSQETFNDQHENVLRKQYAFAGDTLMQHKGAAFQDSYVEHLEQLGLLDRRIQFDRKDNIPKVSRSKGKLEMSSPRLTTMGTLLLLQIGLLSNPPY